MTAARDIAQALTEPGMPPYRMGTVVGFDFMHQPPLLYVDDLDRPMRFLGDLTEYNYFDSVCWVIYNGAPLVIGRFPQMGGEIEGWHLVGGASEPAFQNSWVNFGGAHATAGFYIQPDGWVRLKGLVKDGTNAATIFTLPAGYRPPIDIPFTGLMDGTVCTIEVTTSGTVTKTSGATNGYVSLGNITFPTVWNRDGWLIPELDSTWSRASIANPTAELFQRDDGWCWMKGAATGSSGTRILTLPVQCRTILDHILVGDDVATIAWARMNLSYKGVIGHGGAPSTTSVHFGGKTWFARAGARAFSGVSYQNSWSNLGTTFEPVGYYKDHFDVVHLQGSATGTNTNTIFNLPAGYRPAEQHIFFTLSQGDGVGRIDVTAAGDVSRPIGTNGYLSFNGVSFRAEQ